MADGIVKFFLTVLVSILLHAVGSAQDKSAPRFEDYPAAEKFSGRPVSVNLRSHPKARLFRTALRNGVAKNGVNFAGHYTVVSWGCGSDCRMVAVVDARTGTVYFAPFTISTAADFRPDSSLFIANAPEADSYLSGEPLMEWYEPRWYVWRAGRFVQIFRRQAESIRKRKMEAARRSDIAPADSLPASAVRKTENELLEAATQRVEAIYPPIARAARASGEVIVQVSIDERGRVAQARALSGHPLLRRAAEDAARGWQFKPQQQNGENVSVVGLLTFRFQTPR